MLGYFLTRRPGTGGMGVGETPPFITSEEDPAMRRKSRKSGSKSDRKRRRPVGLTHYQEEQIKRDLRLTTPSEPWVEAQFRTVLDSDTDGTDIVYRYRDPHAFPPGGAETLMVRCDECGVFNPPNAIEHGNCLDHANHDGWGPSPSAIAIQALRKFNLELEAIELLPEDTRSLEREIQRFARKNAKVVKLRKKCKS
jgi:hypothetical protein